MNNELKTQLDANNTNIEELKTKLNEKENKILEINNQKTKLRKIKK